MERAATRTFPHTRLLREIDIDLQQQLKKLGVTQQDMAHFDGLFLGRKRLSQNRAVCSRPLRGISYSPSRYLINWAANAIKITDRTQIARFGVVFVDDQPIVSGDKPSSRVKQKYGTRYRQTRSRGVIAVLATALNVITSLIMHKSHSKRRVKFFCV